MSGERAVKRKMRKGREGNVRRKRCEEKKCQEVDAKR